MKRHRQKSEISAKMLHTYDLYSSDPWREFARLCNGCKSRSDNQMDICLRGKFEFNFRIYALFKMVDGLFIILLNNKEGWVV